MNKQAEPNLNLEPIALGFMFDDRFRRVVARDYEELGQLEPELFPKSVLVVSGSIIEGLLSDAILACGELQFDEVVKMDLGPIIVKAFEFGILEKKDLPTVLREYRNLVHPGREIRERIEFDKADATIAKAAVEVIFREVKKWSKYFRIFQSLTSEEKKFLALFGEPGPKISEFEHPWLELEVYTSHYNLTKKEIVVCDEMVSKDDGLTQRVSLVPDAVRYVENLIPIQKVIRVSLNLNLRNIAANGAAGSGATGSF